MSGGDGLFFIIAEDDFGKTIYGMHNYGSSRNESSILYSDQTFLLAKKLLGLFQRAFKKNSFLQQITLENLRHSLTQAHPDQDI